MEQVQYKIVSYFENYRIGTNGSLWSKFNNNWLGDKWKLLSPTPEKKGHLVATLINGKIRQKQYVHCLVLEAFVGYCPFGLQCLHWDGNPANNNLTNLRWGTQSENMMDRVRHGTSNRGERNGKTVLTEENVLEIRLLLDLQMSCQEIGRRFNVDGATIRMIKNNINWKWLQ